MAVLLLLLDISVLPLVVVVVVDDFVPETAITVGSGLDNAEAVVLCNSVENNPILLGLLFFDCGGGLLIVSKRPIGYCKYMFVGFVLCTVVCTMLRQSGVFGCSCCVVDVDVVSKSWIPLHAGSINCRERIIVPVLKRDITTQPTTIASLHRSSSYGSWSVVLCIVWSKEQKIGHLIEV